MMRKILCALIGFVCLLGIYLCCVDFTSSEVAVEIKEEAPPHINVFCSADDGNAKQMAVSLASLLSNVPAERNVSCYIVYFEDKPMSDKNKKNIESLKKIRDYDLEFVSFDGTKLDVFSKERWNKAIFVKLFACEVFEGLDKIMWIDDDIIINKDVIEFYDRDLECKYMAGVDVSRVFTMYHNKRNSDFWINCGMNIYNLKEMRKDHIQEKLLEKAKEYTEEFSKSEKNNGGAEEFAFTYTIDKDKFLSLPQRYCVLTLLNTITERYFEGEKEEVENGVVFHYAGIFKPWSGKRHMIKERYLDIWDKYYKMTPYYE